MFLFFIGCQPAQETATVKSLDNAVAELQKLLVSGTPEDLDAIATVVIQPGDLTQEGSTKLAEMMVTGKLHESFTYQEGKVAGNMAIAVFNFDAMSLKMACFAKWEDDRWNFIIGINTWASEQSIQKLDLNKANLKDALLLKKWIEDETQVGKSGIGKVARLKWYLPFVPDDLVIEKFHETPSPSMDHTYIWKIKIFDTKDFNRFQKQLTQPPPNVAGTDAISNTHQFEDHPEWWKSVDLNEGKHYGYWVAVVNGEGEKANLCAFFDKQSGYLYIQAF